MKEVYISRITYVSQLETGIYDMGLYVEDIEEQNTPKAGQFIEIYLNNGKNILPRPISICDITDDIIRVVFQVVGEGTKYLSELLPGERIKITAPLGNGFDLRDYKTALIVGGGIGTPPLLKLCKDFHGEKHVFFGFRSKPILINDFLEADATGIYVATDDGSTGYKGNVVSLMREQDIKADVIYACGPKIMLKSVAEYAEEKNIPCYVSMEERMACGFGVCVGCAIKVKNSDYYKKVCVDGPVFNSLEVDFDE